MPRGRPRKQPSIADLQMQLGEQRQRRAKLTLERKKFQGKIEQIDREIASLEGGPSSNGTAGGGSRARNDQAAAGRDRRRAEKARQSR